MQTFAQNNTLFYVFCQIKYQHMLRQHEADVVVRQQSRICIVP